MNFTFLYSLFYGFILASIVSFAHVFSIRVIEAYYGKTRKKIANKWSFILSGRSRCDYCSTALPLLYVLPLIGFFLSRGRCGCCHSKISKIYIAEEWIAFIAGFSVFFFTQNNFLFYIFLAFYLFLSFLISYVDMKYFLIPTESLVSFLIIAVIEYLILGNVKRSMFLDFSIPISWSLLFFLMVYLQPQKMGFADIYLVGLMTFAVGFPASLFLPTVASFFAILYFFIKYRNIPWVEARKNKIPFGVFLSLAFLILKIIPIPDIF